MTLIYVGFGQFVPEDNWKQAIRDQIDACRSRPPSAFLYYAEEGEPVPPTPQWIVELQQRWAHRWDTEE